MGLHLEREALKPHHASLALPLYWPFQHLMGVRVALAGT